MAAFFGLPVAVGMGLGALDLWWDGHVSAPQAPIPAVEPLVPEGKVPAPNVESWDAALGAPAK